MTRLGDEKERAGMNVENFENGKAADQRAQEKLDDDLLAAANVCSLAEVERLLSEGADARRLDSSALCLAANEGSVECVRALLPHSDASADHCLALRTAALRGSVECVGAILPFADLSSALVRGWVLEWGALSGSWPCMELLIQEMKPSLQEMRDTVARGYALEAIGSPSHAQMRAQLNAATTAMAEQAALELETGGSEQASGGSRGLRM